MFVVLGANGNTGSVVAATLLAAGKRVRAVARDAAKLEALRAKGAEVVTGNVEDAADMARVLAGAEGAYLLAPPDAGAKDLVGRGRRVVDNYTAALAKTGVKHAVFLSSIAAQHPAGTGPVVITHYAEQNLPKAGSTQFTFLRAAYFMENLFGYAQAMKNDGMIPVFGGGEGYPFPMVATPDIGRVAAEALLAPPASNQVIELAGPKEYSMNDAAAEASQILGRPVKAMALPLEAMVPTLTSFGFSENVAGLYKEMTQALGSGLFAWEGTHRSVRGTVTLGEILRAGLR